MKRTIATLTLLLACIAGSASTFLMRSDTGLTGQTGWSLSTNNLFFSDGAMYSRMNTGTTIRTGLVSIAGSAGTYRIWMRARAYDTGSGTTNMSVRMDIGDQTLVLRTTNSTWTVAAPVNIGTSFTSASITVTNPLGSSGPYDIYLNGFYFGNNTNEAFVASANFANTDNLMVDYSPPTITNSTDIVLGNHIPNSSFEAGLAGGWAWDRAVYTNQPPWLPDALDTTEYHSGVASIKVGDTAARYRIHTPIVRLRGATNIWRPYTFSFWAKSTGSITPVVTVQPAIPGVIGFPNPNLQTFTMSPSVGTSWVRKSTNIWLCSTPSREVYFQIYHVATGTNSLWVDDVMLEEGHTLNAWAPANSVEVSVRSKPTISVFLNGESPWFDLVCVNGTTNMVWQTTTWDVFDHQNSKVSSGRTNVLLFPGVNTTRVYGLPSEPGPYRILARRQEYSMGFEAAECIYTVLGYSSFATDSPSNSLWGSHSTFWGPPAKTNIALYIPWNRTLSASGFGKWSTAEPTNNVYDWSQFDWTISQWPTNLNILVSIGDLTSAPAWALTNSFPLEYALVRYMSNLVSRYPQVKAFEMANEPHYHYTAAQSARITELMVEGLTNGNPNAVFIAGGGQIYTNDFGSAWALVNSTTKSKISNASVHLYPETGQNSWNGPESDVYVSTWTNLYTAYGLTGWNTEMGTWAYAPIKVIGSWPTAGNYSQPFDFEELAVRSHFLAAERLMRQSLRMVGYGFRNFQYDTRLASYKYQIPSGQPTLFHFDDSLSAQGAAYSFGAYLIRTPVGRIAAPSTNVESYLYSTADGRSVIAAWTYWRSGTNAAVTLTNSAFGLLNLFGATLQTNIAAATITRTPRYLVSSLTTGELASAWSSGSITYAADTSPPNVQIDISPGGAAYSSEVKMPLIYRWTSVDSNFVNTVDASQKVQTRWRIPALDTNWSVWSNERLLVTNLPISSGDYAIEVQTKDTASSSTNTATGPTFGINSTRPKASAVVKGSASASIINKQ